jgi:hypothetical protein
LSEHQQEQASSEQAKVSGVSPTQDSGKFPQISASQCRACMLV